MAARTEALGYARTHARQTDRCTVGAVPALTLSLIPPIHQSQPQLLLHLPDTLRRLLLMWGEKPVVRYVNTVIASLDISQRKTPPRGEMTRLHSARS